MAASIYATPPPDLNGEENSLSDASNTSQLKSQNNSHPDSPNIIQQQTSTDNNLIQQPKLRTTKRSNSTSLIENYEMTTSTSLPSLSTEIQMNRQISSTDMLSTSPTSTSSASPTSSLNHQLNVLNALTASLVDAGIPDLSKKRRKQTAPMRISATGAPADSSTVGEIPAPVDGVPTPDQSNRIMESANEEENNENEKNNGNEDPQQNGNFQAKLDILKDLAEKRKISESDETKQLIKVKSFKSADNYNDLPDEAFNCDKCGIHFESELKLGLHLFQTHGAQNLHSGQEFSSITNLTNIKNEPEDMEIDDDEITSTQQGQRKNTLHELTKSDDWVSMGGLTFPFLPEAAAMLSASGYLSHLPIGVPTLQQFASASEGISRGNAPPLRIFNPEAYCDLCNKEFCNKYFLKTHKANKHNIYEPAITTNDLAVSTNQMNQMSQVLQQIQQHQMHQHQLSQQHQQSAVNNHLLSGIGGHPVLMHPDRQVTTSTSSSQSSQAQSTNRDQIEATVYCDICLKKFTNIFAMRRHRSKVHEIPSADSRSVSSSPGQTTTSHKQSMDTEKRSISPLRSPFVMPEGFREDYSIEQEDVSFTPKPRVLPLSAIQQAREANFAYDKLKRLGVINPEAFCELCCKEYCNKYFLRTHKYKRHGILLPPDDPRDDRLPWQYAQSSPLNLITASEHSAKIQKQLEAAFEMQKSLKAKQLSSPNKESINMDKDNDQGKELGEISYGKGDIKLDGSLPIDFSGQINFQADNCSSPEAISVDLQKLQSMILQLNDLNAQKLSARMCGICGKEMENPYMLQAHMIAEHSMPENNNLKRSRSTSPVGPESMTEICKHCDKDFPNTTLLKQHIMEVHGNGNSNSPQPEGFVTPDRPIQGLSMPTTPTQIDRRAYTITPTSSYCEICNKELCNKYFMKTHMQRMHGIEIENGAQIGGVVCNICNKELCSKYFLRVHKHNTHGIVDENSAPLPATPRSNGETPTEPEPLPMFPMDPVGLKPSDLAEFSNRYYSHFTEVCPLCSRRFRSAKWLRAHLLSDHGKLGSDKLKELEQQMMLSPMKSSSPTLKIPNGGLGFPLMGGPDPSAFNKQTLQNFFMGEEPGLLASGTMNSGASNAKQQKEFKCSVCPFTTPSYAFLFIHERSHPLMATGELSGMNEGPITTDSSNNQLPSNDRIKSESAVSLAKELPSKLCGPSNSNGSSPNRMSSPLSLTPKEASMSLHLPVGPSGAMLDEINQMNLRQLNGGEQRNHILMDIANMLKRPTSYAQPQDTEPVVMQSFLVEEIIESSSTNSSSHGGMSNKKKHHHHHNPLSGRATTNNNDTSKNHQNLETDSSNGGSSNQNRFVPSVVFLPVKERINDNIVVSFKLTPV